MKRDALPGTWGFLESPFAIPGPPLGQRQARRPNMTQVSKMGPWFSPRAVGSGFW